MGLIQKVKRWFQPKNSWAVDDDRWYTTFWPQETASGSKIDEVVALSIPAAWACIKILSEDIGSLPLHLYTRLSKGKQKAVNHPLYYLLHDRPNPELSAMSFRETIASHILAWGNCYAEKEVDGVGRVKALWPWPPNKVEVYRDKDTREIYYLVQIDESGQKVRYPRDKVLHIPGLSFNGLMGYSPIGKMREAMGMAAALEEFGARFFGQGTHPGAVVSHPGKLGAEAHKHLKKSLADGYSGLGKSHRLLLLEEGMKLEAIGIPPEDAQFLETRRFQLAEIARIYKMPLHKLQEYEKGMAFASVEQFSLDYVVHTLRPWLVRTEQAYNWQLFNSDLERRRYFWEHLVDGLLRGDLKTRYDAYAVARNWGWLSADDIREFENLNPLPDDKGKIYLQPLNMVEAGTPPLPPAAPEPITKEPGGNGNGNGNGDQVKDFWKFRGLFCDAVDQILNREIKGLKKVKGHWIHEVEEFYNQDFERFMQAKIMPPIQAFIYSKCDEQKEDQIMDAVWFYTQEHIKESKEILLSINGKNRDRILDRFTERSLPLVNRAMTAIAERLEELNYADA